MIGKFIKHDLKEGLIRYRARYILLILVCVITCIILDRSSEYFIKLYGQNWSLLEFGINNFYGRMPFHYSADSGDTFAVPFGWILQYLVLSYCIGDYIRRDMHGFGMYMIVQSKKRSYWWISKCIWCCVVNIVYFALIWCVNISYVWIAYGEVNLEKHALLLESCYGTIFGNVSVARLLIMTALLPMLAGIVQSLFQITISIIYEGTVSMAAVTAALVIACYYGNPFLPHGYAMVVRYFPDNINPAFSPNQIGFGIVYLCGLSVLLAIIGYLVVRKKDIYGRSF